MYELHGQQETTDIRPGDTLTRDASWMHVAACCADLDVPVGAVGYAERQTTDKRGPGATPEEAGDRYRVYALGLASSVAWPGRRARVALKLFREFGARSTFEGYSIQLAAAFDF